jgi:acetyl-CoA carboxylase beta subunit
MFNKTLKENFLVCNKCSYHFIMGAMERLHHLADAGSFVEIDADQAERTVEFLDGSRLKDSEIRVEVARR